MKFGYFTLSDNHYENNYRDANSFVANIRRHLEEDRGGRFRRVVLNFNVGLKPHAQVKDLMARFTAEVARPLLTAEPRTTAELQYKAVARHSRQRPVSSGIAPSRRQAVYRRNQCLMIGMFAFLGEVW